MIFYFDSEGFMKKIKNLGAALLYIAIFIAEQFAVVTVFELGVVLSKLGDIRAAGGAGFDLVADAVTKSVNENVVLLTIISDVLFVLTVFLIFSIRKKSFFKEVGFLKADPRFILPVIALGASFNIISWFVCTSLPFPDSWWEVYNETASYDLTDTATIIAAVIIGPIAEELLVRGLVFTRVSRGFGVYVGAVVSSVIFGLMHGTIIWILYTTFVGLLLSFVFVRSRSLIYPMLCHLSFNLISVFLPNEIPIAWIVVSFVVCAASVACLIFFSRKTAPSPVKASAPAQNGTDTDGEKKDD